MESSPRERPLGSVSPYPAAPDRLEALKRGTYVLILLMVFVASSFGLVIGALANRLSPATALVFFLSASFCALSIWVVVARATALHLIERAIWAFAGVLSVGIFFYGLYLADTPMQSRLVVAVSFLWLLVAYASIFVARDPRSALWRSIVLFLTILAIYLPRAAGLEVVRTPSLPFDAAPLALLQLSSAVMIAALLFFGILKTRTLEAAATTEQMRWLADTDPLTELPNRRRLTEVLDGELGRTRRYDAPLSLIIFDLDDFKRINDLHGHDVGDSVLIGICQIVEPRLRGNDILGRWGGEEFVIVAPHTTLQGAQRLVNRIREGLKDRQFGPVEGVTASYGVAAARTQDDSASLVKRADEALYRAKRAGKNRVECEKVGP